MESARFEGTKFAERHDNDDDDRPTAARETRPRCVAATRRCASLCVCTAEYSRRHTGGDPREARKRSGGPTGKRRRVFEGVKGVRREIGGGAPSR